MKTTTITPSVHYFGTPVALISTTNDDQTTNLTPVSSLWALDDRYVVVNRPGMSGDLVWWLRR